MTDSTGAVVWAADYKPFGEATVTVSTITNNLRFPGQYFDAETGLLYNLNRDYNQVIGRYIEADPIGQKSGINLYQYVDSNPVNWIDPEGLAKKPQSSWYEYRNCQQEDWSYCNQKCGSKGAKDCGVVYRVGPFINVTKVNVWCKCNDDEPNQCKLKQPNPFNLFFLWLTWQMYMNQQLQQGPPPTPIPVPVPVPVPIPVVP